MYVYVYVCVYVCVCVWVCVCVCVCVCLYSICIYIYYIYIYTYVYTCIIHILDGPYMPTVAPSFGLGFVGCRTSEELSDLRASTGSWVLVYGLV